MTTITIDRAVVEQALEACTDVVAGWQSLAPLVVRAAALESLDALRAALAQPAPEPVQEPTPAWWRDGLAATLMREGIKKHRAREIAAGYWEAYLQIPGVEDD